MKRKKNVQAWELVKYDVEFKVKYFWHEFFFLFNKQRISVRSWFSSSDWLAVSFCLSYNVRPLEDRSSQLQGLKRILEYWKCVRNLWKRCVFISVGETFTQTQIWGLEARGEVTAVCSGTPVWLLWFWKWESEFIAICSIIIMVWKEVGSVPVLLRRWVS